MDKFKFDKANRNKIEWIYNDKPMQRLRSLNANKVLSTRNPSKPLMVFCCDTFDLFQPSISDELRNQIFDEYDKFTNLTLQIQTTYPAKMNHFIKKRYQKIPSHYWFGMSAGTQRFLDKNANYLLDLDSSIRFVVFEPLLEKVEAYNYFYTRFQESGLHHERNIFDWIIIGGESGNAPRPCSVDWIRSLVYQAKQARHTNILVKQYGSFLSKLLGFKSAKGKEMSEWADDLQVREFPQ